MAESDTFRGWLNRHNLGPTEFCRAVERIGGRRPARRTVQEWARDSGRMSAADWALLALMEAHRGDWDIQRTPAIGAPESQTAPNDTPVTIR